jgi:hypothetical protein
MSWSCDELHGLAFSNRFKPIEDGGDEDKIQKVVAPLSLLLFKFFDFENTPQGL